MKNMNKEVGADNRPYLRMRDKTREIWIGGKKYTAIFTADALAEVMDEYGGLTAMYAEMGKNNKAATKIATWLIALVINQGVDYDRHYFGKDGTYITEADVRFMPPREFMDAQRATFGAINDAFAADLNDAEEEDEVLAEIKKPKAAAKK